MSEPLDSKGCCPSKEHFQVGQQEQDASSGWLCKMGSAVSVIFLD